MPWTLVARSCQRVSLLFPECWRAPAAENAHCQAELQDAFYCKRWNSKALLSGCHSPYRHEQPERLSRAVEFTQFHAHRAPDSHRSEIEVFPTQAISWTPWIPFSSWFYCDLAWPYLNSFQHSLYRKLKKIKLILKEEVSQSATKASSKPRFMWGTLNLTLIRK